MFWIVTHQPSEFLTPVAFIGAVAAALLVYVLSWRGGVAPSRLVLVGIGVNAALTAATVYLLVKFPIQEVEAAVAWSAGSVYASSWADVRTLTVALAVLIPLAAVLMWHLRILQFGDEMATSLGLPVEVTRLGLLFVGCGFSAVAVGIAGPIGFVALMSPTSRGCLRAR